MFRLHREKVILLKLLILLLVFSANAQEKIKYQPEYDHKDVRWGFFLGYGMSNYGVKFNTSYVASVNGPGTSQIYSITSPSSQVLKAGALVNVQLNDYFDLRFSPLSLAIYNQRQIVVNKDSTKTDYQGSPKAWFEFPVLLKYKSERRRNSRMFIFAGLKFGIETNITNKKRGAVLANNLNTKTKDLSLDFGFGLDMFREYFKYTPEIHFSHGLVNMANRGLDRSEPLSYVDKLKTNTVTFLISF